MPVKSGLPEGRGTVQGGRRNGPKSRGRREKGRKKIGRQENQHEKGEGRMS